MLHEDICDEHMVVVNHKLLLIFNIYKCYRGKGVLCGKRTCRSPRKVVRCLFRTGQFGSRERRKHRLPEEASEGGLLST